MIGTLGEILRALDQHSVRGKALFLPPDEVWSANTPAALLDDEDQEELPQEATSAGLQSVMRAVTAQEIVSNARQQRPVVSEQELVNAFLFYYDNDAFIIFGAEGARSG